MFLGVSCMASNLVVYHVPRSKPKLCVYLNMDSVLNPATITGWCQGSAYGTVYGTFPWTCP